MTAEQILQEGLKLLNLKLPTAPFMHYLDLILKWNKAYNLTAILEKRNMVTHHILDSLSIIPFLQGPRILDVGSGAGLPGIPLALALPNYQFVLLDSNGKKTRFLIEVKRQLALTHVEVIEARAENYQVAEGFDTLTCRAVTNLKDLAQKTKHLLSEKGIWVAMKGQFPAAELQGLEHTYTVASYQVPGLNGKRCCVIMQA